MDVKSCVQQSTMLFARNASRATWKKQLLLKGRVVAEMEWVVRCFALRLQRVCINMFYHVYLLFLGGSGGSFHDGPWVLNLSFLDLIYK